MGEGGSAGGVEARMESPGVLKVAGGLTTGIVVSLLVGRVAFAAVATSDVQE